jgi:peptidyl-tRNA hydrolase
MRAAQMFHAARQFQEDHPEAERQWFEESNTIVLLEVEDEEALEKLISRLRDHGVSMTEFSEPDYLDAGITAIAAGPGARRFVSSIPLAFR